ncbi:MAG TPA: sialate O-acetylesterase, partial [Flavisolibacter sp.]|nr:sialate O-acetylesterase [Flavisolibacter sp.]
AFRQAQAAALSLPHTGMIVTTDMVDNLSDIHPTYKWEIGRRLALLALVHDYQKTLVCSGPVAKKAELENDKVVISFDSVGSGLQAVDSTTLSGFELAGKDGVYMAAMAKISGNKVWVHASALPSPKWVRFAWNESAQPNFFNKNGLPAVPFEMPVHSELTAKK